MTQAQALNVMKLGHNVFLTGEPGAGKTYVLNKFIDYCREHNIGIGITASTGIAATHIGGMTIHSWSGIGIHGFLAPDQIKQLTGKTRLQSRFKKARVLIIDEISMLDGTRLDLLNQVCKAFKTSDKPFGGLQVILCGDLFQLPPVTRGNERVDFAHASRAWDELDLKVCYLSEQHRQQEDAAMLRLLREIRSRELSNDSHSLLQERLAQDSYDEDITRLYSHNVNVDELNNQRLRQLDSEARSFTMVGIGNDTLVEQLKKSCLAPEVLELKIGAQVLCVANNPGAGFVNGSRAEVVGFEYDKPVVRLTDGREIILDRHSWRIEDGEKVLAEVSQFPLRLAWAITVHKSQGMSLDAAEVDLSRAFTPGMGYVALSRLRSLNGLYLRGINQMALEVSPEISELDGVLQHKCRQVIDSLSKIPAKRLGEMHAEVRTNLASDYAVWDKDLFEALRAWRWEQSKKQALPPFMIFDDKTLVALSAEKPQDKAGLINVPGIGPKKLDQYGDSVLSIIYTHSGRMF